MNTKTPSDSNHEKKVINKVTLPNKCFKYTYGETGAKFIYQKKYKNTVYAMITSSCDSKINVLVNFKETIVRKVNVN